MVVLLLLLLCLLLLLKLLLLLLRSPDPRRGVPAPHLPAPPGAGDGVRGLAQLAPQPGTVVGGRVVPEERQEEPPEGRHAEPLEVLGLHPSAADPGDGSVFLSLALLGGEEERE